MWFSQARGVYLSEYKGIMLLCPSKCWTASIFEIEDSQRETCKFSFNVVPRLRMSEPEEFWPVPKRHSFRPWAVGSHLSTMVAPVLPTDILFFFMCGGGAGDWGVWSDDEDVYAKCA